MAQDASSQSGDPGRTPGAAEGDKKTIEQDLKEKGLDKSDLSPNQQRSGDNKRQQHD